MEQYKTRNQRVSDKFQFLHRLCDGYFDAQIHSKKTLKKAKTCVIIKI